MRQQAALTQEPVGHRLGDLRPEDDAVGDYRSLKVLFLCPTTDLLGTTRPGSRGMVDQTAVRTPAPIVDDA